jgi:phospholipid-binding lipoprotein MlaA
VTITLSLRVTGRWLGIAAILVGSVLCGCATPPTDPEERAAFIQNNDPLEPLNRQVLAFNQVLDKVLLRPAAKVYVFAVPEDGRRAIRHILDNMKEPTLFFNHVLQGDFKRAGITLGRFAVNSTIGVGGIVDVMALNGVERQPADFGQTLFVWGVPSGPYLVIPVLGPSNPRDAIGRGVDSYADPFTILANERGVTELTMARLLADGVDERASVLDLLDDLEKNSVNFYAQLRSLTQQHRNAELHHGAPPAAEPGLYDDPDRSAQPAPPPAQPAPPPVQPAIPSVKPSAATVPAVRTVVAPTVHPADPDEGALR